MQRVEPLSGATRAEESEESRSAGDEPLMEAVRLGDDRAFEMLMTRYKGPITSYLGNLIREPEQARELAQEVFLRVYRAAPRYKTGSFSAWLYTIATNLAYQELRRRRRWALKMLPLDEPESVPAPGSGTGGSPDALLQAETTRQVRTALQSLPPRYRIPVALRDLQGLSYEDVAAITRLRPGTVKTRIHRGRLLLKEKLRPFVESHAGCFEASS